MRATLRALAVLVLLGTAGALRAQERPVFIPLPVEAIPVDVGANGFVVLGTFYGGRGAFTWMPTDGVVDLGGMEGVAISRDGRMIVGDTLDANRKANAAIWQGGREWRLLGSFTPDAQPCDALLSGAFGASDDGKVIVGLGWDGCKYARAFRWEESTGMVDLGSTNGESTRANDVSGDGRVVVGWQEDVTGPRLGAMWRDGVQQMIRGPLGPVGEAFSANFDGSLVVGTRCGIGGLVPSAWTWTAAGGVTCFPVEVPDWVPDHPYSAFMFTTSDDGRVIGGSLSFGLDAEAVFWLDGQVHFLRDYLRENGIPDAFDGWINTGFINGVTSDGRVLVGYGAGPIGFQGYMVVLPERK